LSEAERPSRNTPTRLEFTNLLKGLLGENHERPESVEAVAMKRLGRVLRLRRL